MSAPAPAAPAAPKKEEERPKNHIRVSSTRSKFLYVDIAKYLLAEGEPFVEISGLGTAICDVADIVEVLKNQKLVIVKKIETARGVPEARRRAADRLTATLIKAPEFDKIFAEQKAAKEAKKAAEAKK